MSPVDPDPMLTVVCVESSVKSHWYCCVALKELFAPGSESVPFIKVTGKPDVPSSLTPLTTESAISILGVCVEYTSKLLLAVCGIKAGFAVEWVNNVSVILYFVSPAPEPATVDPSSDAELV